ENEVFCILGGNGSGKSTSLLLSAGLLRPYRGKIRVFEKDISAWRNQELYRECLAMLPQDVSTLFLENTVANELKKMHEPKVLESWFPFDLSHLKDQHPYDLSGGEMQLLGMLKVLSENPRILLMDEPTKGLDPASRRKILEVVRHLKKDGKTLVIVTHDVEFAAAAADRCAFLFRGEIVSCDVPRRFFSDNYFYTTAVSRMTKGLADGIVTLEDAEKYFKKQR
ncbi:MAG: ABC transporter ATP-binding protein, partial [Lachnospiraceae bacterium]|nr:ABC transporter ATP-binding protein [Lachnospiraceae bacterium]